MTATARKVEQKQTGCCGGGRVAAAATSVGDGPHHGHVHGHAASDHLTASDVSANAVRDPVCGMVVDPHTTSHRHQFEGRTYYFCSAGCLSKFKAEPGKYLAGEPKAEAPVPEGAIYTCPMHPEIRRVGPGSCPVRRQGFWDHWRRELTEALAHQGCHIRLPLLDEASGAV